MICTPRSLIAIAACWAVLSTAPLFAAGTGASQPGRHLTQDSDNLWNLAAPYERGTRVTRQQWMVAALRRNPDAFLLGNMHRMRSQVALVFPSEVEAAAESHSAAEALIVRHFAELNSNQPMPALPAPLAGQPPEYPLVKPTVPVAKGAQPAAPPAASSPTVVPGPAIAASTPTPATASSSAPVATSAASAAQVVRAGEPAGLRRWLPHAMAATVALLALGLMWRMRRRRQPLVDAVSRFFQESNQPVRKSDPQVLTVSNAGADIARSVERLTSTAHLVCTQDEPSTAPAASDIESSVKLEIARAHLELGRQDAAITMLKALATGGAPAQRQAAQQLLGNLGAA